MALNDIAAVDQLVYEDLSVPHSDRSLYNVAKRSFDIVFSLLLLVLLLPGFAVVALLVRVTSPGPIVIRQSRCGLGGSTFTCYKFRTMIAGADSLLEADQRLRDEFTKAWKLRNDPRVTPVGRWLRRLSIDELPQLVNVIRGEMSIVGPRPVQPAELEAWFNGCSHVVTSVRPGLTGLWQVSGRSLLTYDERIDLDLEYVQRRGFWYDAHLVLRTIPVVVSGKGAI